MESKSTEFFRNLKSLPPAGTKEFEDLIGWELEKIMGGVNIGGVYIPGILYGHLNHWHIYVDKKDNFGNIVRVISRPDLRDNEWERGEYFEGCRTNKNPETGKDEVQGYIEVGGRQGGKDLLNSSLLYQEDKEIHIGDCSVGDAIYGADGKLTTITGKFPQGKKAVYKLTLVDGRVLNCGLEHNWYVYDRFSAKYVVKTTKELIADYKRQRMDWVGKRKNSYEFKYSIPVNSAVEYSEKTLPIDPYILGLWLGDGSNTYSKITSVDKEIIDYIYDYAEKVGLQVTIDDVDTFMITSGIQGGNKEEKKTRNFVHQYLKGLYNNKHIPDEYKYSCIEQRMELLRGLMDSDGTCTSEGGIEFNSSIPALAQSFYSLCRSLGINLSESIEPTHYKKDGVRVKCKNTHRFRLYTDKKVFKLTRKLDRIKCKNKYLNHTAIVDIEYMYDEETTCITVDNEDHLFLTDNYTVTHNSEWEASYIGMTATVYANTQNVLVAGNGADLKLLTDKIDLGFDNMWEGIKIPKLDKDWRRPSLRLGFKDTANNDHVWSYIMVRNAEEGKNTEAGAGTTAKSAVYDEIGKYPFSQTFEAHKPAFISQFGWRCVPMLVGTGGAFEKGADAERVFYHPRANNFRGVIDPKTGQETGLFLSGLYRQDCKVESNLYDYLVNVKGRTDIGEELKVIPMRVSDKELAESVINQERAEKSKDPDRTVYLKNVMYFPLTIQECFQSSADNFYNGSLAAEQEKKIYENNIKADYGELEFDGEKIVFKETPGKVPISSFPTKDKESLDAPVQIWEHPVKDPPWGLYVAGVDPYRFADAVNSDSLGCIYIFKRLHDISSEKYQDCFVACYTARPEGNKTKWNKQAQLLIKYYNATALCENDEMSFIDHMNLEGDGHHMADTPGWLIDPSQEISMGKRPQGISRSALKTQVQLRSILKSYLEEKLTDIKSADGTIVKSILGMSQVFDPLLCREINKWNYDGNFDREVAASLAVAQARRLDKMRVMVTNVNEDTRLKSYFNKDKAKSSQMFGTGKTKTIKKKRKTSKLFH